MIISFGLARSFLRADHVIKHVSQFAETKRCPSDDIAAYVDGELSESAVAAFEGHVKTCRQCARNLREQRQFLSVLSASLAEPTPICVPDNFAIRVASTAESTVAGIRRPNELLTAVCISAALLLFSLFAFGSDAAAVASAIGTIGQELLAVGLFVIRMAGGFIFAIAVISRSLASSLDLTLLLFLTASPLTAVLGVLSLRRMFRRLSV